jgi:hypothetical protein
MQNKESVAGEQVQKQTPSTSKRSLLRSAWVAPVIVAVTLPRSGYAANISGGHSQPDRDDDKSKQNSNNGNHFGELKKGS